MNHLRYKPYIGYMNVNLLKVVCRLALTIWSYWHGCREQIFLNISNASNAMETP